MGPTAGATARGRSRCPNCLPPPGFSSCRGLSHRDPAAAASASGGSRREPPPQPPFPVASCDSCCGLHTLGPTAAATARGRNLRPNCLPPSGPAAAAVPVITTPQQLLPPREAGTPRCHHPTVWPQQPPWSVTPTPQPLLAPRGDGKDQEEPPSSSAAATLPRRQWCQLPWSHTLDPTAAATARGRRCIIRPTRGLGAQPGANEL